MSVRGEKWLKYCILYSCFRPKRKTRFPTVSAVAIGWKDVNLTPSLSTTLSLFYRVACVEVLLRGSSASKYKGSASLRFPSSASVLKERFGGLLTLYEGRDPIDGECKT